MINNPAEPNFLGPGVVNSEPMTPMKVEAISPVKPANIENYPSPPNLPASGILNSEPVPAMKTKATKPANVEVYPSPPNLLVSGVFVNSKQILSIKTEATSPVKPANIENCPSPPKPDQAFDSPTAGKIKTIDLNEAVV